MIDNPATNPPVPTPFGAKLNSAWEIVAPTGKFADFAAFKKALADIGATSEDALSVASFEDLQSAGLPVLTAKQVAKIFRAKSEDPMEFLAHRPIAEWPIDFIVKRLDPKKSMSPEAVELKRRVKDDAVIFFKTDGTMDVDLTIQFLEYLQQGLPKDAFVAKSRPYKVGHGPWQIQPTCPAHPDIPLVNGVCYKCHLKWDKLSLKARQLVYYIVRRKFADPNNRNDMRTLFMSLIVPPGNQWEDDLGDLYPEAFLDYSEAEKLGKLPALMVDMGTNGNDVGGGSPFGPNRTR